MGQHSQMISRLQNHIRNVTRNNKNAFMMVSEKVSTSERKIDEFCRKFSRILIKTSFWEEIVGEIMSQFCSVCLACWSQKVYFYWQFYCRNKFHKIFCNFYFICVIKMSTENYLFFKSLRRVQHNADDLIWLFTVLRRMWIWIWNSI